MEVARPEAAEAGAVAPAAPQWVIFVCSGQCLAVALDRIREILTPRPFTRLPGAGPGTAGLIAVRSRIVTAYDLGIVRGLAPSAAAPDHRILLVDDGSRVTGLIVDEVLAVAALEEGASGADPTPADACGASTWEGRSVTLLELERVLTRARHDGISN
jgi:chemotaxis signal transduction protein